MEFDAVILDAGDFPVNEMPLSIMRNAKFMCCCDDAAVEYINRIGMPDAIVGDGDSLPQIFKDEYKDIIHIEQEQADNDQTKATRFCINNGAHRIAYLGATGKREDHTLGNISLMVQYLHDFDITPVMFTDYGYFTPARGKQTFKTFPHQQVTIINFGCKNLQGEGLKWEIYPFGTWWQGTLNEAIGDDITICGDNYYLVFRTYEPK